MRVQATFETGAAVLELIAENREERLFLGLVGGFDVLEIITDKGPHLRDQAERVRIHLSRPKPTAQQ